MMEQQGTTEYFRLEVAADLVHLPTARVRRYVRRGLIRPRRVEGRIVLFGEEDLARLRKIRRLIQDLGLNAAGVEVALSLLDQIEVLQAALRERADGDAESLGQRGDYGGITRS